MQTYTPRERAAITRALNIIAEKGADDRSPMSTPSAAYRYLRLHYEGLDASREHFSAAYVDSQNRLINCETLFSGTVDGAAVYPRVVARRGLETNASAIVLCHNHPSGVLTPSPADRMITTRIADALALLDIRVLDHMILGPAAGYYSFAERGDL